MNSGVGMHSAKNSSTIEDTIYIAQSCVYISLHIQRKGYA